MNVTYRKNKFFIAKFLYFLPIPLILITVFNSAKKAKINDGYQCDTDSVLVFKENVSQSIVGSHAQKRAKCFHFYATSGQSLILNTNTKITISTPSNRILTLQGSSQNLLTETGNYSIIIFSEKPASFSLNLKIISQNISNKTESKSSQSKSHSSKGNTIGLQFQYNVTTPPAFNSNYKLQKIVDNIINFVQAKGLPTEQLSVSLVDLNSSKCCAYASYLDREPRFPASIVKLFWMVYLYGQYQAGVMPEGTVPQKTLSKMIQDSDNEAASLILDKITRTESGKNLYSTEIKDWIEKRYSVNNFFESAGYERINISQKVFPIPYLKLDQPEGRDLQIREKSEKPIRNYVTTYSVARLLFEIYNNISISKYYSSQMKVLLSRNLQPEAWQYKEFNSISGFLGESLPSDTYFASKMGWTFDNRNDAAIVVSPDGKARYILVVFGDDPSFFEDKKVFPEISRMVYNKMINIKVRE